MSNATATLEMPDAKQRQALVAKGYEIEDMGAVYGRDFKGQYRWLLMNWTNPPHPDNLIDFQDDEPSYSEDAAWRRAFKHAEL